MIFFNHRHFSLVHVLWIGILFIAASLTQAQASNKPELLQQTILIVGDSISAGFGIEKSSGWVALLQQRLGPDFKLVNASISGETTSGGRHRLAKLLQQYQPDLVVIELGGNDGLRGTPIKQMQFNLNDMVQKAQASGADVMLLGMRIPPNYGARYTEQFVSAFSTIASEHSTLFVPFLLAGVAGQPGMMQADGIHPTAKAQPVMMELVWSELQEWLKNRTNTL